VDYGQELDGLIVKKVEELSLRLATEGVSDFETEFTRRFRFSRADMKNSYFQWWAGKTSDDIKTIRKTRRDKLRAKVKEASS
jgi:hypothetical protein